jgi:hypothetical protein
VLTGDLVASSDLSPEDLDIALNRIEAAVQDMASWQNSETSPLFARRGGDGWQVALAPPAVCLRAALYIRASLRRDGAAVTRMAIAVGDGTLSSSGDLNSAHGPVFTASGRLLSDITGHALMAHAAGSAHHAATRLADHIASGWTQAQVRAVAALLPPDAPPRAEVAATFGITRQAVNQALWSAGFPALDEAIRAIEAKDSK